MFKKQNREYGPEEATKVVHKMYRSYAHDPNLMGWISVFDTLLFRQIIIGIGMLSEILIDHNKGIVLENIFLKPQFSDIVKVTADMVIWGNNEVVTPFRTGFFIPDVSVMNWYHGLSEECDQILDRVQGHIQKLANLCSEWLEQLGMVEPWLVLLQNFIEMIIINQNTEYVKKRFFFRQQENLNLKTTQNFITAQLTAFERIRTLLQKFWVQNLNDVVSIINTVVRREYE